MNRKSQPTPPSNPPRKYVPKSAQRPFHALSGVYGPQAIRNYQAAGRMSLVERDVWMEIYAYAKLANGACTASNHTIGSGINRSGTTIKVVIRSLKAKKLVRTAGFLPVFRGNNRVAHSQRVLVPVLPGQVDVSFGPTQIVFSRVSVDTHSSYLLLDSKDTRGPGGPLSVMEVKELVDEDTKRKTPTDRFTDDTPPGKLTPLPVDYQHAERLRVLLVRTGKAAIKWNLVKWANEFRLLRLGPPYKGDAAALSEVLAFYERNAGAKGFPNRVGNAEGFRNPLVQDWLRNALREAKEESAPETPKGAEVTAALVYDFGAGRCGKVRPVVENSIRHHAEFIAKLRALPAKAPKTPPPVLRLAEHLAGEGWPSAAFALDWLTGRFRRVEGWADWSGDVKAFTFHPSSKAAGKHYRDTTEAYSGRPRDYDLLLSVLGYPEVNS